MGTTLRGIDISHYQKGLNVATSGVDFVIMKATEGTSMVDAECDRFYQAAKKAGKLLGVYHFYRGSGQAEADFFLKNITNYIHEAVLALDFEDSAHKHDVSGALAFLTRVYSQTGVRPLIYMNRDFATASNWSPVIAADFGLWYARPGVSAPDPTAWGSCAIWQSGYTTVPGYSGQVDSDVFYGDRTAWAKYANPGSAPAPTPAPAPPAPAGIAEDGAWGTATTTALQTHFGTVADGQVWGQYTGNKAKLAGCTTGWQWTTNPKTTGSPLIKAMQSWLGITPDGVVGPKFASALSSRMGTVADGTLWNPSPAIKEMQHRINTGTL